MTGMTPQTQTAARTPAKFCAKGAQLHAELQQHELAIRDTQREMREVADAEDSIARRVPRSLHDTLKSYMQQRALSRLQWTRHVEKCWDCTLASTQAARPSKSSTIAA